MNVSQSGKIEAQNRAVRDVLDSVDAAVWTYDPSQEAFTEISPAIFRMTGYTAEALSRLECWTAVACPEDLELLRSFMADTEKETAAFRVLRIRHADGGERWLQFKSAAVRDPDGRIRRFQGLMLDVTEQKRQGTVRELSESESFNQRLIEWIPEPIILHRDFRVEFVNAAARALLGVSEDVTGRPLADFMHPDDRSLFFTRLEQAYRDRRMGSAFEMRLARTDGAYVDAEAMTSPIVFQGRETAISIFRDITEHKQLVEYYKTEKNSLRIATDRYDRLQLKLDRFSSELFGIVNISELERRLIAEIREVVRADRACLIEAESDGSFKAKHGSFVPQNLPPHVYEWSRCELPLCKIKEVPEGYILKIGEIYGKMYLVCIGERPYSLELEPVRIWLETLCRYVSVLYDNFRTLEDLTRELERSDVRKETPAWLNRIMFRWNENERKRLAQDLHDSALQEQIIWYRKLDQLLGDHSLDPPFRAELERIAQGLLDVMYQIRHVCMDLRPPMLKEAGIISSLESLFELTQLRSDFVIRFEGDGFPFPLQKDVSIGIYRIVQEILSNASKHARATKVDIALKENDGWIELAYTDNGVGMELGGFDTDHHAGFGMGIHGIKERVNSMNGTAYFDSSPGHGVSILIRIPSSEAYQIDD